MRISSSDEISEAETLSENPVVLRAKPFRGLTFAPFRETEASLALRESLDPVEEAYDRLLLRMWHGACEQVFAGARDEEEVDERLDLLASAHETLHPKNADQTVDSIRDRFFGIAETSDSAKEGDLSNRRGNSDLMDRYLSSLEDSKTSPTVLERSEREWTARRIRKWLEKNKSDPQKRTKTQDAMTLLVARLVRTSLPMGSVAPEMPKFLCGWNGWPHVGFREIGTILKHSCKPNAHWTCLDGELVVRSFLRDDANARTSITVNLVSHLDSRRTFESDGWRRVAKVAFSGETLSPDFLSTLIRGRHHAGMLKAIHGLECQCDGTSLREESKILSEETFYELERRCGQCGQWSQQKPLLRCSVCKFQRYCGVTCQRRHWNAHKRACSVEFDLTKFREILFNAALTLSQS